MREPSVTVYTQELHALTAICTWKSQVQSLPVEGTSNLFAEWGAGSNTSQYTFYVTEYVLKHGKNTSPTTLSESVFGRTRTPLVFEVATDLCFGEMTRIVMNLRTEFTWAASKQRQYDFKSPSPAPVIEHCFTAGTNNFFS